MQEPNELDKGSFWSLETSDLHVEHVEEQSVEILLNDCILGVIFTAV